MSRARPDPGFMPADSNNLPKVDDCMFTLFFNSASFINPEMKNVKALRSCRASYGDYAIGYVQLKREGNVCRISAKMTPETSVRKEPYIVKCDVNENEDKILTAKCNSCVAKEDTCKHAIAFLAWLERKAAEPAPTSVQCYWETPALAKVATSTKVVKVSDLNEQLKVTIEEEAINNFLSDAYAVLQEKAPQSIWVKSLSIPPSWGIHVLMIRYKREVPVDEHSGERFIQYLSSVMTEEDCEKLAKMTKAQADSPLWDDARFGRVSASKVWEASRCQKGDGCLKNRVLGGGKFKATSAMERGTNLEKDVLKQVQKRFPGHQMKKTGFKVLQTQPIFGASPDGILGDYIVEVKCPSKKETYPSYFTSNFSQPANKYKGQMHLQMLACGKKKGLFCVASPNFKEDKAVKILRVSFDRCFSNQMMRASKEFWILYIYPILYANY